MVGGRHHQMQLVGHHQNPAPPSLPQVADQIIEFILAVDIHALNRLVQHQQIRFAQQRPRQQRPLHLAAGNRLHRRINNGCCAHFGQRRLHLRTPRVGAEGDEALHCQRQGGVYRQPLRHIAEAQARFAPDPTAIRTDQTQRDPRQGGLARAVGAN